MARRTLLFIALFVCSSVTGNLLLGLGARRIPDLDKFALRPYMDALLNPWVASGIVLLILALLCQLALLSWADLSFVVPTCSVVYVVVAIIGYVGLDETVTAWRWAGVCLVSCGVALVGGTAPSTNKAKR